MNAILNKACISATLLCFGMDAERNHIIEYYLGHTIENKYVKNAVDVIYENYPMCNKFEIMTYSDTKLVIRPESNSVIAYFQKDNCMLSIFLKDLDMKQLVIDKVIESDTAQKRSIAMKELLDDIFKGYSFDVTEVSDMIFRAECENKFLYIYDVVVISEHQIILFFEEKKSMYEESGGEICGKIEEFI